MTDDQSFNPPTDAEEEVAAGVLDAGGEESEAAQIARETDEEKLAKLAAMLKDRPTFASDRRTGDRVYLPGHDDEYFVPRPLTRQEVLKLESIQARARTWMKPGDSENKARAVDTQAARDEYYNYLCGVGIAEYDLMSKEGRRKGKYHANASHRQTEQDFAQLDPVVGEYVQLYLEIFNGISDEQRRERGNG